MTPSSFPRFRALPFLSVLLMLAAGTAAVKAQTWYNYGSFSSPNVIPAFPGGADGVPLPNGGELVATGGDVTVTYLGWNGAADDEYLFLTTPGGNGLNLTQNPGDGNYYSMYTYGSASYGGQQLIDNQVTPAAYTVDLGTFAAGTELEFGIYDWYDGVDNGPENWLDGPGSRNSDGQVHAYVINNFTYQINQQSDPSGTYVGFEDQPYPGGDFNYADLQFVFNGVQGQVPESGSTLALIVCGLGVLALTRRHSRRSV